MVDWLCILGWVAVTALIGIPLYLTGLIRDADPVTLNLVAFVVMVAPVTIALAMLESGVHRSTFGKRIRRLQVVTIVGGRLGLWRALARNALKVALPWGIGHLFVYGLVETASAVKFPSWLQVAAVFAYGLPLVFVVSLFVRGGRTPYDHITGTVVVAIGAHSVS